MNIKRKLLRSFLLIIALAIPSHNAFAEQSVPERSSQDEGDSADKRQDQAAFPPRVDVSVLELSSQVKFYDLKQQIAAAKRSILQSDENDKSYQAKVESHQRRISELAELKSKALQANAEKGIKPEPNGVFDEFLMDEVFLYEELIAEWESLIKNADGRKVSPYLLEELKLDRVELERLLAKAQGGMPKDEFLAEKDEFLHDLLKDEIDVLTRHKKSLGYNDKDLKQKIELKLLQRKIARTEAQFKPLVQKVKAHKTKKYRAEWGFIDGLRSLEDREPLIPTSEIAGATVKASGGGKAKFDHMSGLMIITPPRFTSYLVLKDETVIRTAEPPSDIDLARYKENAMKKRGRVLTRKEVRLSDKYILPPHQRGYRLNIYAEYNTPGMGGPTLRGFRLNKDGSFELNNTRLIATQDVGTGYGRSVGAKNLSGMYFIDGNTIELRSTDGIVVRKLFATDGKKTVIFGGTQYTVK